MSARIGPVANDQRVMPILLNCVNSMAGQVDFI